MKGIIEYTMYNGETKGFVRNIDDDDSYYADHLIDDFEENILYPQYEDKLDRRKRYLNSYNILTEDEDEKWTNEWLKAKGTEEMVSYKTRYQPGRVSAYIVSDEDFERLYRQ